MDADHIDAMAALDTIRRRVVAACAGLGGGLRAMKVVADMSQVKIPISEDLYNRLHAAVQPGEDLDALVERAIGPESSWRIPRAPTRVSSDLVRPVLRRRYSMQTPALNCACCPVVCRFPWVWRGVPRCNCTPAKIAAIPR